MPGVRNNGPPAGQGLVQQTTLVKKKRKGTLGGLESKYVFFRAEMVIIAVEHHYTNVTFTLESQLARDSVHKTA